MEKEQTLSHNQKILQALAGKQSVHDWGSNLGDERLRMSRVMVAKLIRTDDEDVLDIVAEYLGVRLVREDAIDAEIYKLRKQYPDYTGDIDREHIRRNMEGRK